MGSEMCIRDSPYESLSDLVTVIGTALGIAVAVNLMRMDNVRKASEGS